MAGGDGGNGQGQSNTGGRGGTQGNAGYTGTGTGGGGGGAAGFAGGMGAGGGGAGGAGGTSNVAKGTGGNSDTLMGGAGYAGVAGTANGGGGGGGEGGFGLIVGAVNLSNNEFVNTGAVRSGDGGAGGAGASPPFGASGNSGGGGGGGGAGTAFAFGASSARLANNGMVLGGTGGTGGYGGTSFNGTSGSGGAGGYGGTGISMARTDTLANTATIYGGKGGRGGGGGGLLSPFGARGGRGGLGVDAGLEGSVENTGGGTIGGGDGGDSNGNDGGDGGTGISFGPDGRVFTNDAATVFGGDGGTGFNTGSGGGSGGIGVSFTGTLFQNLGTGKISGGAGGDASGRSASGGSGGIGADFSSSAFVINTGTIAAGAGGGADGGGFSGGRGGLGIQGANLTIVNTGTISGGTGGGSDGGFAGGGGFGIQGANLTIVNNGKIAAGASGGSTPFPINPIAVAFTDGANTMTLDADATFAGALVVATTTTSLTFSQSFPNVALPPGVTISASVTPPVDATLSTAIIGAGSVIKDSPGVLTLTSGESTYAGGTTIRAGTLDLEAADTVGSFGFPMGAIGTGAVTFSAAAVGAGMPPTAILALGAVAQPANGGTYGHALDDFGDAGEALDLHGYTGKATATFKPDMAGSKNGTLTVKIGTTSKSFTLTNAHATQFTAVSDNNGGTIIAAVCFAQDTAIRTSRGEVAVENLEVGDLVMTAAGATRPIRWLGHRMVDCRAHPRPQDAQPVRIAAHAFGHALPARDLLLSPGHPVLVGADADNEGGYLVPIMCLINGTTIERVRVERVTYWHVELDAHDILLAEGLPAESYLDWGDRAFFTEGSDHALANPDFVVPGLAGRCRPIAIDGPVVEAERRRLDGVFATRLASAAAWPGAEDSARA